MIGINGRQEPFGQVTEVITDRIGLHYEGAPPRTDSLSADNARFLAVDVQPVNRVLLIDGDPSAEEAFYVEAALSARTDHSLAVHGLLFAMGSLTLEVFAPPQ